MFSLKSLILFTTLVASAAAAAHPTTFDNPVSSINTFPLPANFFDAAEIEAAKANWIVKGYAGGACDGKLLFNKSGSSSVPCSAVPSGNDRIRSIAYKLTSAKQGIYAFKTKNCKGEYGQRTGPEAICVSLDGYQSWKLVVKK